MTIKRRKMVGAYSTHGKEEKCMLILCWENPIERDLLKYLSLSWRIILKFMGPCIANILQYTSISNKMQLYTVYLYLETTLHVSGSTSTHNQERLQLYVQHLVFVTPHCSSNSSTMAAGSGKGVTNTRCCRYSCMRSWWWVEVPPETCRAVARYK
jgi:hypothetical protein